MYNNTVLLPARTSQLNPGVYRAREASEGACDCAHTLHRWWNSDMAYTVV